MSICSVYQYMVVHSKFGNYCVIQTGILQMEGQWMHALIALQGIRNVFFLIWEVQSIHVHKEETKFGYNVISSDEDSDEESA